MSDVINRRRPIVGPRARFDFTVAAPVKAGAERLAAELGITLTALIEEALLDKLEAAEKGHRGESHVSRYTVSAILHPEQPHVCTVCLVAAEDHDGDCPCGCGLWWPPLCCEGCACGSWEEAHRAQRERPALLGGAVTVLTDKAVEP